MALATGVARVRTALAAGQCHERAGPRAAFAAFAARHRVRANTAGAPVNAEG